MMIVNMQTLIPYLYMLLACICVGIHIFSFKYIQKYRNTNKFLILTIASLLVWCISRIFIYIASYSFDVVFMHLLLNMSVFVTFILSVAILKNDYEKYKMLCGLILAILGLYLVKTSIIEK